VARGENDAGGEGEPGERGEHQDRSQPQASNDDEQEQGECEVELLLDGQRPGVHQRHLGGWGRKIARLAPEQEVRSVERDREDTRAEPAELLGREDQGRRGDGEADGGEERREDPSNSALVEVSDGEATGVEVSQDDSGDEISGDDEEDIDANEPAAETGRSDMEEEHGEHGNAAKPVDIAAMLRLRQ